MLDCESFNAFIASRQSGETVQSTRLKASATDNQEEKELLIARIARLENNVLSYQVAIRDQDTRVIELERKLEQLTNRINNTRELLTIANMRIDDLTVTVATPAPKQKRKGKDLVKPTDLGELVNLWEFAAMHNVAVTDTQRGITLKSLHPIIIDNVEMLDAAGRRAFWELNHNYKKGVWQDCPDCPHTTS